MNNKIKIKGLNNLVLLEGCEPKIGKEYLVSIVAERSGIRYNEKDPEDIETIFEMDYIRTAGLQEIGTAKKLKVEQGRTQSQKLRFVIEEIARMKGLNEEEYYKEIMGKIIEAYQEKLN